MEKNLNSFFNAKSVAVIGASNSPGKVGNIIMKKLDKLKGRVIPINKGGEQIEGKESFKKITDYPKKIELAIIATPAKTVPKIIQECVKKEIKNIIIISAGFSEIRNYKLEKKILNLKLKHNLNILGPNCFGMINPKKNLDLTFAKETVKKGNTVFISQSGALGSHILDYKIPLRAFISVGNMIDLNFADWIEYFNEDKKTKKIVCYIESLHDGKRFIEACKNSKKEIIVVKAGKTEKGKDATMSHTASLATDYEIYKGAFKQAKVKQSKSLIRAFGIREENIIYKLKGKKVAIITNAGGAGALLADQLESQGYEITGPKDILGTATAKDYKSALNRIKANYDSIIIILTPQMMSEPEKTACILAESKFKHKIVACFLGKNSIEEAIKILQENGISYITKAV
jgi:acyl-CoA synthetase (NDP forming)